MQNGTIFSVTSVIQQVKSTIEKHPSLARVSVEGEISDYKQATSGHMYFSLIDGTSKLRVAMFAGANRSLRFAPQNGMKVIVTGNLTIFEREGQFQMIAQSMFQTGEGLVILQLEQLRRRLVDEGLFSEEHKKSLPSFPRTIGVVTSPTGAVIRDIITTVRRRYPLANILLYPSRVQGVEAPLELVEGIVQMNRHRAADVLIIGRGGGSNEDLGAFNDERVVRAMFASEIPIISAVGHDTDSTLTDMVADRRASTPTAAAELAVPDMRNLLSDIEKLRDRMQIALRGKAFRANEKLQRLKRTPWLMQPLLEISRSQQALDFLNQKLRHTLVLIYKEERERFSLLATKLDSLSPLKVMGRGYGLVSDADTGQLVRNIADSFIGQSLEVHVSDGQLNCTVNQIEGSANKS